MTMARSTQIDFEATQFYHCMTRCVRGAYLCGIDHQSGRDYSERKTLVVNRIEELAQIFSIHIASYAVMSNHYHIVLYVNCSLGQSWDDSEVISRWAQLFKFSALRVSQLSPHEAKEKILLFRERLTSISWFMRCLNEYIARLANKEDDVKGRFWEGRFKCQALLDEGALLSAMAYVDLNPVRAKIAQTPEESDFTSIQKRIRIMSKKANTINCANLHTFEKQIDTCPQPKSLMHFNINCKNEMKSTIDFSLSDYLELVDSTGRVIREDKPGAISEDLSPILERLNLSSKGWLSMVQNLEIIFFNAIGCERILFDFNKKRLKSSPKGINQARKCYASLAA